MPLDSAERKARKRKQNALSAKVRRAILAGEIGGPPPKSPRLTADPAKADVIRLPSGKALPTTEREARRWLKQSS